MCAFLAILFSACLAITASAQLVLKAGNDGTVYSPQPFKATSTELTTPVFTGTITGTYTLGGTPSIAIGGITGLGTGVATFLATPSGANLLAAVTDETGTGVPVFSISPTLVTPIIGVATATSIAATGAITSSSPSAKIGYATGAGGVVTQGTTRTTTVVMVPNPCLSGAITTTADSIAGLGLATFTVTDSAVAATDVVVLSKTAGDVDTFAWVNTVGAGSFTVTLRNSHATDADTTAFVFNFAVIKAVAN